MSNTPAVPGASAWITPPRPTSFYPQRDGGYNELWRRWPAVIRFLANDAASSSPVHTEEDAWILTKALSHPDVRKRLITYPFTSPAESALRDWIVQQPELFNYWRGHGAFRSQREFEGWDAVHEGMNLPRLEPYEIASWRLTDDIGTDADVMLLVAWCQGVQSIQARRNPLHSLSYREDLVAGLLKLHNSPWCRLGIAAPFMNPTGILFPPVGYIDSCVRMEFLLRNTVRATDAELAYIMASTTYKDAYATAIKLRSRRVSARYTNPAGAWYVGNSPRALGEHFRRGGGHLFKGNSKKSGTKGKK